MDITKKLTHFDDLSRNRLRLSLMQLIFWASFCLLLVIHCIENTSLIYEDLGWMKAMYMLRNVMYVLLLAKAGFLAIYRPKELWCMLAVLPAGVLCVLCSGDFALMEFAVIVIAAKDIPARKLVKVFAIIKAAAIVLTLALAAAKILPNIVYENTDQADHYTYGFCHRNVLGANMAVLCLAWFYLRYKKLQLWDYALWVVLTAATYLLADSRTSLLIMVLSIGMVFACHWYEERILKMPRMRQILVGCFVGLFLISLVCTVFYKRYDPFWEFVDKIFTKRLRFAHQCLDTYGFSLFGQEMDFVSTLDAQNDAEATRLILDNAYMRGLLHNGIIPCALFLFAYCKSLDRAWLRKNLPLIVGMAVMAIYGMSERFMLDVYYNFPLLVACLTLFRQPNAQNADTYRLPFEYAREVGLKLWQWCRKRFGKTTEAA